VALTTYHSWELTEEAALVLESARRVAVELRAEHRRTEASGLDEVVSGKCHSLGFGELGALDERLRLGVLEALAFGDSRAALALHMPVDRLEVAAILCGVSQAAYEHAREYCLVRTTFGRKVAHHQGVAFMLADMAIAVEAAWLMVDARHPLAFLQARECALAVTVDAVQLLGAAGYVRDHPVEKWMREARELSLMFGGEDGALEEAEP